MLYARSLETMALCASLANDAQGAVKYNERAKELKNKIFESYWNQRKSALVHSRIDDKQTENVTRYANMFGIFFDYFTPEQKLAVKKNVLLNNQIAKITTPYMRFYELEALCVMGEQAYVLSEMKNYWGGMLKLGATSFWEEYNPDKKGTEHLAMYGRPFGKSLCHAWGASPIYLLGKYYLGVEPSSPGYETYTITPNLGGLAWMEGKVPTPNGEISIYCSKKEIKVYSPSGTGKLRIASKTKPVVRGTDVKEISKGVYEVTIEKGRDYSVAYLE